MNVCHVAFSFFPGKGSGTAIYENSRIEAELGLDVSVVVLGRPHEPQLERMDQVTVHRIPAMVQNPRSGGVGLLSLERLDFYRLARSILLSEAFDLVRVYASPGVFLIPWLSKQDMKWIYDLRSGAIRSGLAGRIGNYIARWQACFFDATFVISEPLARRVFGTRRSSLYMAPLGVNLEHFQPTDGEAIRHELGLTQDSVVLVYSGSMHPTRQLQNLLYALKEALTWATNLKLLFLGDGADRDRLQRITQGLGLEQYVLFAGHVEYDRMPRYLCAGDIALSYVPQTQQYDGQPPLKTAEYLACGLPVIATDTWGHRVFVEQDHNGRLTDDTIASWAGAICELAQDPALRMRLSDAARETAAEHGWHLIVRDVTLPAYLDILKQ